MERIQAVVSGVAELRKAEVTETNGLLTFQAEGEIVEPVEYKGSKTTIVIPLYDTPYRMEEENILLMFNEIRKLGLLTENINIRNINKILQRLVADGVYFRFHSWNSKEYGIIHAWDGVVDYVNPDIIVKE